MTIIWENASTVNEAVTLKLAKTIEIPQLLFYEYAVVLLPYKCDTVLTDIVNEKHSLICVEIIMNNDFLLEYN